MFFEGFTLTNVAVPGGSIRLRHGGSGPPLLLLHGNPQTHAMWHLVAPELGRRFTVVCPDLRGYGFSLKPPATADHAPYAKREMAKDMAAVMDHFGHPSFRLAGHDRGARLSHRIALDFPDRVEKLAVLDIIPTLEHFERANMEFGLGYYHWFWFAQPHPFPEWLITKAPEEWWRQHTSRDPSKPDLFHPDALADYMAAVRQPEMVRGMCEDYRAAATIDLKHDRESRAAGRKVQCPTLVLWGSKGKIGRWYDALAIWRQYIAAEVIGGAVDSGHYIAEENPAATLDWFGRFFG
ncbi:MAG: alpha/beta hydrolase [Acetobacteraceae bacterium]|nr:alpha/beta hydrolase [Acetobacteraceae bacterium]